MCDQAIGTVRARGGDGIPFTTLVVGITENAARQVVGPAGPKFAINIHAGQIIALIVISGLINKETEITGFAG